MKRGRAAGIRVRPRDETIGCQHLIWAGPAPAMLAICAEKPARKGRDAGDGLRVAGYRYALSMLVTPEAIPKGWPSRVFLIADPARPLIEDNAIAVTVGPPAPRDPGRVPSLGRVRAARRRPSTPARGTCAPCARASASNSRACLPFLNQHLMVLGVALRWAAARDPRRRPRPRWRCAPIPMPPVYTRGKAAPARPRRPAARAGNQEPLARGAREPARAEPGRRAGFGVERGAPGDRRDHGEARPARTRRTARRGVSAAGSDALSLTRFAGRGTGGVARFVSTSRPSAHWRLRARRGSWRGGDRTRRLPRCSGRSAMKPTPVRRNDRRLRRADDHRFGDDLLACTGQLEPQATSVRATAIARGADGSPCRQD